MRERRKGRRPASSRRPRRIGSCGTAWSSPPGCGGLRRRRRRVSGLPRMTCLGRRRPAGRSFAQIGRGPPRRPITWAPDGGIGHPGRGGSVQPSPGGDPRRERDGAPCRARARSYSTGITIRSGAWRAGCASYQLECDAFSRHGPQANQRTDRRAPTRGLLLDLEAHRLWRAVHSLRPCLPDSREHLQGSRSRGIGSVAARPYVLCRSCWCRQ